MWYLLIVLLCFIICFSVDYWGCNIWEQKHPHSEWSPILSVLAGAWLIVSLVILPLTRESYKNDIAGFEATKTTIVQQREFTNEDLERATLIITIIEANEWLAESQSKKQRKVFNWYIPNQIVDITPIE